jgi:hypothetical protein
MTTIVAHMKAAGFAAHQLGKWDAGMCDPMLHVLACAPTPCCMLCWHVRRRPMLACADPMLRVLACAPTPHAGRAAAVQTPHGRGFDSSLGYFDHAIDYWSYRPQSPFNTSFFRGPCPANASIKDCPPPARGGSAPSAFCTVNQFRVSKALRARVGRFARERPSGRRLAQCGTRPSPRRPRPTAPTRRRSSSGAPYEGDAAIAPRPALLSMGNPYGCGASAVATARAPSTRRAAEILAAHDPLRPLFLCPRPAGAVKRP